MLIVPIRLIVDTDKIGNDRIPLSLSDLLYLAHATYLRIIKLVRLWNNAQTAGKFHSSRLLGRRGSIRERVRLERLVKRERATAHSEPNARTAGASYRISLYCAFAVSQRHVSLGCRRYYRRAFSVLIIFRGIIETGLPGWLFLL